MDKSDVRFVLDLSLRQISLNPFFRPVFIEKKVIGQREVIFSHC